MGCGERECTFPFPSTSSLFRPRWPIRVPARSIFCYVKWWTRECRFPIYNLRVRNPLVPVCQDVPMTRKHPLELQGHRGARGLKPENTLPSFEAAFDAGVSSVETDVRLSADGMLVLFHDDLLTERLCRLAPGSHAAVDFHEEPFLSSFSMAELRCFLVDRNP